MASLHPVWFAWALGPVPNSSAKRSSPRIVCSRADVCGATLWSAISNPSR
jgi:hypothetical protein